MTGNPNKYSECKCDPSEIQRVSKSSEKGISFYGETFKYKTPFEHDGIKHDENNALMYLVWWVAL